MTHTDACCCVFCERIRLRLVDVDAWRAQHRYCGDFAGVFDSELFDHEAGDWHWLHCACGQRVLIGTHPLQLKTKKPREKTRSTQ